MFAVYNFGILLWKEMVKLCTKHTYTEKYVVLLPLSQFAILLSLVILVEIAAAIAGYVFRGKVSVELCRMIMH